MRIFSFFLLLFSAFLSASQEVQISDPLRLPAKTNKFKIIGKNSDGIVVRLYGSEDVINVYKDDLKLAFSKTIEFKNQLGLVQHIALNKSGAVIFYLAQEKRFSVLYAQPVNAKFVQVGNPVTIDTIYDRKDLVSANLRFCTSANQDFLFIYYPFFERSTIQSIRYICLDRSLHMRYNKNIPVSREERELVGSKALVDNEGNSSIILRPELNSGSEEFDIFRVSSDGEPGLYSIITRKKFFGATFFELDDKNKCLTICAFYKETGAKSEDAAYGFFFGNYNPQTGAPLTEQYIPFSPGFINELTGRDMKDKTWLYTFNIKTVILRNDGGAAVVAESFIKDTRESAVPMGLQPGYNDYRTSTIYQFNDIVAFSFDSTGAVDWDNIMRKRQVSEDDNGAYSSFMIMNQKDKLRLLYLDDISTSGGLVQYQLSSTGQSTRKNLLNQETHDLMLIPKLGRQVSPSEVVLPSYKNGILQLVKLTF